MMDYGSVTGGILVSTVLLLLIARWIKWRRKKLRFFIELGIPGPSAHFFFGNFLEINEKGLLNCQADWIIQHGSIVGYFNGLQPVLLVADKELLKRILIKDFHLFSHRPDPVPLRVRSILDHIIPGTQIMDNILLNLKGEDWKRVRSILSSIFSANKLKMMIPFVDKVFQETLGNLEQKAKAGEIVDIFPMLQFATLDIISAQTFALHTNIQQEGSSNELYKSAKTVFNHPVNSKILAFGYCFPEVGILGMALSLLKMLFECGFNVPPLQIAALVGKVIEQRRKHPEKKHSDILQFLIDTSEVEKTEEKKIDLDADSKSESSIQEEKLKIKQKRSLSDVEIKASSLVVFLAGYETTSCALAVIIYFMAKYPDLQEKVRSEVDHHAHGKELDSNVLSNLHFLERFMWESMRFCPPSPTSVNRIAVQDVDYGDLKIPKGLDVTVPVPYLHFREENFENPYSFDPDRFLPENRPRNDVSASYWAFGCGPRNCIGSRLFTITSKVMLIKLLQRFTFSMPDGCHQEELSMIVRYGTQVPEKVLVKVKERTKT